MKTQTASKDRPVPPPIHPFTREAALFYSKRFQDLRLAGAKGRDAYRACVQPVQETLLSDTDVWCGLLQSSEPDSPVTAFVPIVMSYLGADALSENKDAAFRLVSAMPADAELAWSFEYMSSKEMRWLLREWAERNAPSAAEMSQLLSTDLPRVLALLDDPSTRREASYQVFTVMRGMSGDTLDSRRDEFLAVLSKMTVLSRFMTVVGDTGSARWEVVLGLLNESKMMSAA